MALAHPRCICFIGGDVLFCICKQLLLSWQDGFHMKGDDRQEKVRRWLLFWEISMVLMVGQHPFKRYKSQNAPLCIDYLVSNLCSDMITCYKGLWFRNSDYLAICWSFYILYILCIFLFLTCVEIRTGVISVAFFINSIFWNIVLFS